MSTITTLTAAELDAVNGAWGASRYTYIKVGGNGGNGGDGVGGVTGVATGNIRNSFAVPVSVNNGSANGTGGNGGAGGNAY
ncbi:hypothetical protein JMJ55_25545 [Belnapia sp. T6]|uniref:PE-PGRS family protein n=1 Tax=Belnapia mucosa TaxID=2804532 RepID=A0ABS1VAM5_9PROT|nr:hypothetical protein [Belnapia mucosa]MBL6458703.1 hypothetical protein [Belnapia mucosa]